MNNLLSKIKFIRKKQPIVVVVGEQKKLAREAIFRVLKQHFKIGKEGEDIFILELEEHNIAQAKFFLKRSKKPVLVITRTGDIPHDKDYDRDSFDKESQAIKNTMELAKALPSHVNLVLNFDDGALREIDDETRLNTSTFGFQEKADFWATDVKSNGDTNFKVNYRGNSVPIWLGGIADKEQIYAVLAAISVGTIFDLNLVEISQSLRKYRFL